MAPAAPRGDPVATVSRSRRPVVCAVAAGAAFLVLSVLVATHAAQPLDVAAREYFRPHDVWGPTQMRVNVVVEGLEPRIVAPLLALVAAVASLRRSSLRPAVHAATIGAAAVALTLPAKFALQRSDPHDQMTALGGSFPSGHMVMLLVCFGGAILIARDRPCWWEWSLVGLVGLTMGLSLLIQATHWLTDVVGGALLALMVLTAATAVRSTPTRARGTAPAGRHRSDRASPS